MEERTPHLIEVLELNEREREHRSRNRLGFHVYLLRYYAEFRETLSPSVQRDELRIYEERRHEDGPLECRRPEITIICDSDSDTPGNSDSESDRYSGSGEEGTLDSTNSALWGNISHRDVMRMECFHWSNVLELDIKEAWNAQEEVLNRRVLPGKFLTVPSEIGSQLNGTNEELEVNVMHSLTIEWENTYRVMRRCITHAPKENMSSREYRFGLERVKLHSQTFRTFSLSILLQLCIFGKDFSKMEEHEVIWRTKRQTLIHISSQKRMCELFTLEGRCLVEFYTKNDRIVTNKRTCSGKVNIIINSKNIIGYILEETRCQWKIQLVSNTMIWLNKLQYNDDINDYEYPVVNKHRKCITKYLPTSLLINGNGNCKMTLNHVTVDINHGNIVHHHSS